MHCMASFFSYFASGGRKIAPTEKSAAFAAELYALARKVRVEHAAARGRLIGDDVAAAEHPSPIGDDVAVTRAADRILRRIALRRKRPGDAVGGRAHRSPQGCLKRPGR